MNFKLRKAKRKDLKKIAKMYKEEYGKSPFNERWTDKTSLKRINNYYKSSKIFVVEVEKNVVGALVLSDYIWFNGKRGHIDEIFITKDFQGKGIGSKLIKFAEKYFSDKKISGLTFISHKKSMAFKFYKKRGYKETGWVHMEKKL
jgi:ribosomal protein S18 acetylase RimI-like enzyme